MREGVDVKLLAQDQELYVLARSHARINKERAMRRRKLKWLWARLKEIAAMELDREELLMKPGAARAKARAAWRLVDIAVAPEGAVPTRREVRRREGCAPISPAKLPAMQVRRPGRGDWGIDPWPPGRRPHA